MSTKPGVTTKPLASTNVICVPPPGFHIVAPLQVAVALVQTFKSFETAILPKGPPLPKNAFLPKNALRKNNNKKICIQSIMVEHGKVKSNCFIIDKKLAYISDVSKIYNKDHKYFKNLKYLVIDCLWYNFHPSHFNLESSLAIIKKFKPKKAILTNLSPVLDYKVLKKMLPKNVIPAHDGLTINL